MHPIYVRFLDTAHACLYIQALYEKHCDMRTKHFESARCAEQDIPTKLITYGTGYHHTSGL